MSYTVYTRKDGMKVLRIFPSEWVTALPTLEAWQDFLKLRPVHYRLHTYGLQAEAETEVPMLTCIACGSLFSTEGGLHTSKRWSAAKQQWSKTEFGKIAIGALIQLDYTAETRTDPDGTPVAVVKTRPVPVVKRGMGCISCTEEYLTEVQQAGVYNNLIDELATLYTKQALVQGPVLNKEGRLVDRTAKKLPSKRTAFIDISELLEHPQPRRGGDAATTE